MLQNICGNCKHCVPLDICNGDCKCIAKSDLNTVFEVSYFDDIRFYGDHTGELCENFDKLSLADKDYCNQE